VADPRDVRILTLGVARRIVEAIRIPYAVNELAHELSVSIGITYPPLTALLTADAADVLQEADEAMYVAKHQGKNRFEVFART
jgi:GGDEF domain-containing protein